MAHEDVFEASVIAIPDEKWGERPVACVVLHEHAKGKVNEANILDFLEPQFAKFWIPDQILFIDRSEEHTSELQSRFDLVCRLLLEKKKKTILVQKMLMKIVKT